MNEYQSLHPWHKTHITLRDDSSLKQSCLSGQDSITHSPYEVDFRLHL